MKRLWPVLFSLLLLTACDKPDEMETTPQSEPGSGTSSLNEGGMDSVAATADKAGAAETGDGDASDPAEPPLPEWAKEVDLASVDIREEADRVKGIMDDEREAFRTAYNAASKEEKMKMRSQLPKPNEYIAHVERLIEARGDDPELSAAYGFLVSVKNSPELVDIMFEEYGDSIDMKNVYLPLAFGPSTAENEARLRLLMDSSHDEVRGLGTYGLAEFLSKIEERRETLEKRPQMAARIGDAEYLADKVVHDAEIEKLYQTVVDDYSNIEVRGREIGKMAEAVLFSLKYLSIGKTAPDIEGEDMDGEEFSLSEYRGKVVMLDFWGDW